MITINEESTYLPESLDLLEKSVIYTHSLYEEESYHYVDNDKISRFFLIRNDGIAIGCGAYCWVDEFVVEVKHIFVDESARGLGCGRKIMEHIEEYATDAGAEQVILETTLKQEAAIGLYLSLGYTFCSPYQTKKHNEQVFMTKQLPIYLLDNSVDLHLELKE